VREEEEEGKAAAMEEEEEKDDVMELDADGAFDILRSGGEDLESPPPPSSSGGAHLHASRWICQNCSPIKAFL
jgi:hypothetical protein